MNARERLLEQIDFLEIEWERLQNQLRYEENNQSKWEEQCDKLQARLDSTKEKSKEAWDRAQDYKSRNRNSDNKNWRRRYEELKEALIYYPWRVF